LLKGVVAVAVVIVAVMVAIRNGYILHSTVGGSCSVVQKLADGSQWVACRPGKIGGRPDLSKHNCTSSGVTGAYEYWKCPADLVNVNP